eukprot:8222-Heterococcus_DN1.PRE.1
MICSTTRSTLPWCTVANNYYRLAHFCRIFCSGYCTVLSICIRILETAPSYAPPRVSSYSYSSNRHTSKITAALEGDVVLMYAVCSDARAVLMLTVDCCIVPADAQWTVYKYVGAVQQPLVESTSSVCRAGFDVPPLQAAFELQ